MVRAGEMVAMSMLMAVYVDGPDALSSNHAQLLMVFVAIAAIALLTQAVVFVAMAVGAMKTQKRVTEILEEVRAVALPLLNKSHGLVDDLTPKVKEIVANVHEISGNVEEISQVVKLKIHEVEPTITAMNETVLDTNRKTKAQITKVDGMVTSTLNATAELGGILQNSIRTPVKEMAGILNGLKAGYDTLIRGARGFTSARPAPEPPVRPMRPAPAPVVTVVSNVVPPTGPAPDAAPAAAAEARNEMSFAQYRAAMQAKRRDLDL